METLAQISHLVTFVGSVLGYIVAGVFGLLYLTAKGQRERRKENDELSDGLIKRLQQTVDQYADDLKRMQKDMEAHTKDRDEQIRKLSDDLKHMQGRNSVLEELFKGRDPAMQEFFKNAPQLFELARESNGLAKANSEANTHLTETISNFINILQPLVAKPVVAAVP